MTIRDLWRAHEGCTASGWRTPAGGQAGRTAPTISRVGTRDGLRAGRGPAVGDDAIVRGVQAAYDCQGQAYAEAYSCASSDMGGVLDRFIERVGPGSRVLDAGCGAGRYMAALEARGLTVTGIDLSPAMLRLARVTAAGELVVMDMRTLSFRGASFQGVWCASSLHHLSKAAAVPALREVNRVLSPGGTLFLGVKEGDDESWENGDEFGDVQRFFARYSLVEAGAILTDAGFDVLEGAGSQIRDSRGRRWLRLLATKRTSPSRRRRGDAAAGGC